MRGTWAGSPFSQRATMCLLPIKKGGKWPFRLEVWLLHSAEWLDSEKICEGPGC